MNIVNYCGALLKLRHPQCCEPPHEVIQVSPATSFWFSRMLLRCYSIRMNSKSGICRQIITWTKKFINLSLVWWCLSVWVCLSLRETESEKFRFVVGLGCTMRACLNIHTHHNLAGLQAVRNAHTQHAQALGSSFGEEAALPSSYLSKKLSDLSNLFSVWLLLSFLRLGRVWF